MKYLLNLTENTLVIGYLEIPQGKYGDIADREAESEPVIYAIRRKWASLHDTPPAELEVTKKEIQFDTPAVQGFSEFPGNSKEAPVEEVVEEVPAPAEEAVEEVLEKEVVEEKPKTTRKSKTKATDSTEASE